MDKRTWIGVGVLLLWCLICTPFNILTDSILLGVLIGTAFALCLALSILLFWLCIDDIKTYRKEKEKDTLVKCGRKFAISSVFAIVAVAILTGTIILSPGTSINTSTKCKGCGKKGGNYSNGYCRSCYKDVEDNVRDDYYDYYK